MGHGHILVETLLNNGISTNTVSKLSVAWLIRKMLMENLGEIQFFSFCFFLGKFFGLKI